MRRFVHILSARVAAAAILLLLVGGAATDGMSQVAESKPAAPAASSAQASTPTAEQERDQRLRNEAGQLNELVQQLQHEMRKAGNDTLSLQAVRLAQQVQALSKQIQAELRQP
jgi:hypothetical protein